MLLRIWVMATGSYDDSMMKVIRGHALLLLAKPFDLFQVKAVVEEILGNINTCQDYNFL